MKLMVNSLLDHLRPVFQQNPDPCSGANTQFSFGGVGMAAFFIFFVQSLSFLDSQRRFHETHNRSEWQSPLENRKRRLQPVEKQRLSRRVQLRARTPGTVQSATDTESDRLYFPYCLRSVV